MIDWSPLTFKKKDWKFTILYFVHSSFIFKFKTSELNLLLLLNKMREIVNFGRGSE